MSAPKPELETAHRVHAPHQIHHHHFGWVSESLSSWDEDANYYTFDNPILKLPSNLLNGNLKPGSQLFPVGKFS
eukprot:CAMPEP_0118957348 /NCGR_PEP_ID=MMETSP1169-20130426/62056_1 /TAXON_ID=36882 /ORGANISM="Pyramimonas obovata, Strain CCMP722" /LENGTH=73 /DNA_ID=CAMNT_0006905421 /DNA_START=303 /DNA_END=524 /DNA_ORIENTATION=+